ncbi:MAG: proline--tRNA ligase [Gemmatimonadetes bacterium]|nr:MAG: proline--tRNA ligase [Gemmatimonadota bacterium]
MAKRNITKRSENYSQWYLDIIREAQLAENAPVRGCMVIRPNGFAIWEKMQRTLDDMFKATGHVNAYFPLFIPKSYLSKEAQHVEGFAKECAIITHYRLKNAEDGNGVMVDPTAKLEEELIVRPTSETMIWSVYKNWIQSYRDLPILINQWANVVRWEMRTRLFLRTAEFLWQEGHTAHRTYEEAEEETLRMLNVYRTFAEDYMAMPVFTGRKTEGEKFAGAEHTYTIEAMMQDRKALQAGTSHNLGQNFAKAFDVKFQDSDGDVKYVWATSWGLSTRMIGALIMTHSDDRGLVLPPKLASQQVVIVPIWRSDDEKAMVLNYAERIEHEIRESGITVHLDDRDGYTPGWKFNEWEVRGIPVRLEIGPRDVQGKNAMVARRDMEGKAAKQIVPRDAIQAQVNQILKDMQNNLFEKARAFRDQHTYDLKTYGDMKELLEGEGGFARVWWNGTPEDEEKLKEIKASVRCILPNPAGEKGACILTGKETDQRVIISKAY